MLSFGAGTPSLICFSIAANDPSLCSQVLSARLGAIPEPSPAGPWQLTQRPAPSYTPLPLSTIAAVTPAGSGLACALTARGAASASPRATTGRVQPGIRFIF